MGYIMGISNDSLRQLLVQRDGHWCKWEHCKDKQFEDAATMTIDHIIPQAVAREWGWSNEEINHIDNFQLLHFTCNQQKSNLLPDEDGNYLLVERQSRTAKEKRPQLTNCCNNGRKVLPGDSCPVCESTAQPVKFPTSVKKHPSKCTHKGVDFCYMCLLHLIDRLDTYDWKKHYA